MVKKKLAVVVPMYNVQDFLKEALDSLLNQELSEHEMQVILIDDGSDDKTFKIAQQYVKKHPRVFEAYSFENAGLGAARNRGTRLANADYITYVDPDDIVVNGSYYKALNILEKTGSDILIGGTKRFNSKRIWNSAIHTRSILSDKFGTTLEKSPELIWDTTSWNKIYSLSFMRMNNFYFPEGMLYEDLPTVIPAMAKAKSLDVMFDTMYLWRVRDFGAPSITQISTNDATPILDRLKANSCVLKSLKNMRVSTEVLDFQAEKFLNFDTMMMFRKQKYELFSSEQRSQLFDCVKEYLSLFTDQQVAKSKFEVQVVFDKVIRIDTQLEFDSLMLSFLRNETSYSGSWINGKWTLSSNISDLIKVATSDDFNVDTKLQSVNFDDKNINLQGYVYAEYSDMSSLVHIQNPKLTLVDDQNIIIAENIGSINFLENKNVTAKFGYNKTHFVKDGADFNYDYSGYQISIPLTYLAVEADYVNVKLTFEVDGQEVSTQIMKPIAGSDVRPVTKVASSLLAAFDIKYDTIDWSLQIKPTIDIAILTYHNDVYTIENGYEKVYLQQGKTKLWLKKYGSEVLFPLPVSERLSHYEKESRGDWRFMTSGQGLWKPVYFAQENIQLPHDTLFKVLKQKDGKASLEISWHYPKTKQVIVKNGVLVVDFELFGWEQEAVSVNIIADPKLPDILWNTEVLNKDTYRLTLPLTLDGFGEKEWLNFQVVLKFIDGYETVQTLKWGDKNFDIENAKIAAGKVEWEFRRVVRNDGGFAIKRTADRVYRIEDGAFDRFIETEYQEWLKEPLLEDHIMMSSFWGRDNMFNDNPEAMYDYLKTHYPSMTTIIMLKNVIREYPEFENAKVVSYGTKEYWYYLARSKYFVNNVNYTEEQRFKRPGQLEMQTMHGTPLKTLGFDVLDDWTDRTYNSVRRKNNNWDYLLTPSDWVADYAKKAFAVSPTIIQSGYPRNDRLFKTYSNQEKNDLKQKIGLPLDKKIIAYTPTWHSKGEVSIGSYLDVESFYNAIPDDTFVVLKNHHFEKWTGLSEKYSDKFAYVSDDATIENLYIVADALITDYSSVMFDFVLLNKPMLFFAFDYDHYIEDRGLNFDLHDIAPGPFVTNQKDLEKWIKKIDKITEEFANRVETFKQQFVQYDTGNASAMSLERLFK